jgi:serine phosphatase RsbU (regulator of sigma subunit)
VVLYTDGLVEVFNPGGAMLGTGRLTKLVRDSSTQPPPEIAQAILRGVSDWRHGPLADDVSLLVVEVH